MSGKYDDPEFGVDPQDEDDYRHSANSDRQIWKPISEAPTDGRLFWGYLHESGIRLLQRVSPEESAEELGGDPGEYLPVWAEVSDHSEQWEPELWASTDDIPLPD